MEKHTAGPWHIGMKPGPMLYGTKGEQIADLRQHWLIDEEHIANVRLMEVAPELLAALEDLFEHCVMVHKHWGEGSNAREADAAQERARAAIAKARGN